MSRFYTLSWPMLRTASTALWRLRSYHTERIPAEGGVLLTANHQSYLDPLMIGLAIPHRQPHFVARRSLFRFGPFATIIRWLNAHPIDRERGDIGALRLVLRMLHEGKPVVIFPEGTRSTTGRPGTIKDGATRIAERAGVPILPVLVEGGGLAWPRRNPLPQPRPINILFGSPVVPSGGFPGPDDMIELWNQLSREPRRRIPGGFIGV